MGLGMLLRYGILREDRNENLGEYVEGVGYQAEHVSSGFLKVVIWGGNGKQIGEDDKVEEVTVCLHYSTHLSPSHLLQPRFISSCTRLTIGE